MRSDFGVTGSCDDKEEDPKDDEFFKKMQKCFSSNTYKRPQPSTSTDVVFNEERDIKNEAYSSTNNKVLS